MGEYEVEGDSMVDGGGRIDLGMAGGCVCGRASVGKI